MIISAVSAENVDYGYYQNLEYQMAGRKMQLICHIRAASCLKSKAGDTDIGSLMSLLRIQLSTKNFKGVNMSLFDDSSMIGGRARLLFNAAVTMIFFALVLSGCGGGGNTPGNELILPDGWAWTRDKSDQYSEGNIFMSGGKYVSIEYSVHMSSQGWRIECEGTWSVSGSDLKLTCGGSIGKPATYEVKNNTLTISIGGETFTYTKTSNVNVSLSAQDDGFILEKDIILDVNLDSDLILPSYQAWLNNNMEGLRDGYIFSPDGTFLSVVKSEDIDGQWEIDYAGTWFVNGNVLTMTKLSGESDTVEYRVMNDTLTMYWNLDGEDLVQTYTITDGVYLTDTEAF